LLDSTASVQYPTDEQKYAAGTLPKAVAARETRLYDVVSSVGGTVDGSPNRRWVRDYRRLPTDQATAAGRRVRA